MHDLSWLYSPSGALVHPPLSLPKRPAVSIVFLFVIYHRLPAAPQQNLARHILFILSSPPWNLLPHVSPIPQLKSPSDRPFPTWALIAFSCLPCPHCPFTFTSDLVSSAHFSVVLVAIHQPNTRRLRTVRCVSCLAKPSSKSSHLPSRSHLCVWPSKLVHLYIFSSSPLDSLLYLPLQYSSASYLNNRYLRKSIKFLDP